MTLLSKIKHVFSLQWLKEPWPRGSAVPSRETCESGVRFYDALHWEATMPVEKRIASLHVERKWLIGIRDRAKRQKKAHMKYQRALEQNTAALLSLGVKL